MEVYIEGYQRQKRGKKPILVNLKATVVRDEPGDVKIVKFSEDGKSVTKRVTKKQYSLKPIDGRDTVDKL